METFLFCVMIVVVFGIGFDVGRFYMCVKNYNIQQENQQLKQILADMQHMEELSYKTWCAMTQEAVRKQPHTQLASGAKKASSSTKK